MECTYIQTLKANALQPRRTGLFLNMTSGVHGNIVCGFKIHWRRSMNGQPAKKGNVWRKEKVSKATMGYTRRIWLPPGTLSRPVLITALFLKIFTNICQHLRKGVHYFDQVKRRSTGVRQNLLPLLERCLAMTCLPSLMKSVSAVLSLSFSVSGDQILISLRRLKRTRRRRVHECP